MPKSEAGYRFLVPVMTEGVSALDRAKGYLHGAKEIDLPAAANYFRKALEEQLLRLPIELYMNDDYTIVPGFKLRQRAEAVEKLFSQIGENTKYISFLKSYLHPLIHPLSHYEEDVQIYRNELIEVENAIHELMLQRDSFPLKCRLLVGRGDKLVIRYKIADGSYNSDYFVLLEDNLWVYKGTTGNVLLTGGKCRTVYMKGVEAGTPLKPFAPNKRMKIYKDFCYISLDDALQKIYDYEVNNRNHAVVGQNDYDIVFCSNGNDKYEPISIRRDKLSDDMI